MKSNLRALPIVEQWDCHNCTSCCRETTIQLNPEDIIRLQQQKWSEHPEYREVPVMHRSVWLGGAWVLAHKPDGSCIFLTEAGRCRIHEQFGFDAKPHMCKLFPLQVVRTDRDACATMLRSCPSAAADRGRPLIEHLQSLNRLLNDDSEQFSSAIAPPVTRRSTSNWEDFHRIANQLQSLLTEDRFPLVRRVVHALRFCQLLDDSKWNRIREESKPELVELFTQLAYEGARHPFENRQPPKRRTARLFRRLGAHFIRCIPGGPPTRSWSDHFRVWRQSGNLARTSTVAPELHPLFPSIAIEKLERPLGPLTAEVLRPLNRFFESHAASKRYALAQPTRPLVENFRRLAFAFPISLWMLRWRAADREPAAHDMVQIVVALERGLELSALSRATSYLAESGELERLIAWYGR